MERLLMWGLRFAIYQKMYILDFTRTLDKRIILFLVNFYQPLIENS